MRTREVLQKVFAGFMIVCIIAGIILMMCESEDWHTQIKTLLSGFGLFLVGAVPSVIISIREGRFHGYDSDL